jgi:hypothetical protein
MRRISTPRVWHEPADVVVTEVERHLGHLRDHAGHRVEASGKADDQQAALDLHIIDDRPICPGGRAGELQRRRRSGREEGEPLPHISHVGPSSSGDVEEEVLRRLSIDENLPRLDGRPADYFSG